MESKKQLKAQLIDRIKELEDSRNALRTKIAKERKMYKILQEKYLSLAQKLESKFIDKLIGL